MSYLPNIPAVGNPGLVDIPKIADNFTALRCNEIGPAEPDNVVKGMWWLDTTSGILKLCYSVTPTKIWLSVIDFSAAGCPKDHIAKTLVYPSTDTIHGISRGTGGGLDADMLDGKHLTDITGGSLITKNGLKVSTGSASGTCNEYVAITMQDYCFFPNIYGYISYDGSSNFDIGGTMTYVNDYIGRLSIHGGATPAVTHYTVQWRYITSSDKPFIYAIRNEEGKIISLWECDDPPPGFWNFNQKPNDFKAPINFINTHTQKTQEIVIFNYPKDHLIELRNQSIYEKRNMVSILNDCDFNETKNLFTRKNLSQI